MKNTVKMRKVGGSLVAAIPKNVVEQEGLTENEIVDIKIRKIRKSGFGLLKGMGPFTKEDELKGQLDENKQIYKPLAIPSNNAKRGPYPNHNSHSYYSRNRFNHCKH